jgi:homogentisate 1,2-dioxygenase
MLLIVHEAHIHIQNTEYDLLHFKSILWSGFKVDVSYSVHNFTLFKIVKDIPTLSSYTLLYAPTLNHDLEIETFLFLLIFTT